MTPTSPDDVPRRSYPEQPIVGVGAVVRRGEAVLLVQRGREPLRGQWSLPGGVLQLGETLAEGVAREVLEETGLVVKPRAMLGTLDRIVKDDAGRVQFHYVLVDWVCDLAGEATEPVAGDDALAAAWVPLCDAAGETYKLSAFMLDMIAKAASPIGSVAETHL